MFEAFLKPRRTVHAHCDLPCGIYDPAQARIEAESVKAIQQRYQDAEKMKSAGESVEDYRTRCLVIKEQRADLTKHHLWVLWTDYFKPEHLEKYPNLHDLVWKTCKLTSTVKQQISKQAAQDLLAGVQQIAEIFWDTKGVKTRRQPANQGAVGGELVYPTA